MAIDLVKPKDGYDQEKMASYKRMADLTYQFPFYDADRITGIATRTCGN